MTPMIWLIGGTYLVALAAAIYGRLADLRWPELFSMFLAGCGVILHVAEVLYDDGSGSDDVDDER